MTRNQNIIASPSDPYDMSYRFGMPAQYLDTKSELRLLELVTHERKLFFLVRSEHFADVSRHVS